MKKQIFFGGCQRFLKSAISSMKIFLNFRKWNSFECIIALKRTRRRKANQLFVIHFRGLGLSRGAEEKKKMKCDFQKVWEIFTERARDKIRTKSRNDKKPIQIAWEKSCGSRCAEINGVKVVEFNKSRSIEHQKRANFSHEISKHKQNHVFRSAFRFRSVEVFLPVVAAFLPPLCDSWLTGMAQAIKVDTKSFAFVSMASRDLPRAFRECRRRMFCDFGSMEV